MIFGTIGVEFKEALQGPNPEKFQKYFRQDTYMKIPSFFQPLHLVGAEPVSASGHLDSQVDRIRMDHHFDNHR